MAEVTQKATPQLSPDSLKQFDYISTRHDALVAQGLKPEDLLNPAYWAHHAIKLKPMDEIRARAEDGTWVAHLLVLDSSRTWARVAIDRVMKLTTADVSQTQASEAEVAKLKDEYKIVHRGPHGWSVVRKADNNLMQEGMKQRDDANAWLDRFVREKLSAPPPAPAEVAVAT